MRFSVVVLTVAAVLCGVASAPAATVQRSGPGITYIGDAIPNTVTVDGAPDGEVTFTDPAGVTGTDGCTTTSPTTATCVSRGVFEVKLILGDGADSVTPTGQLPGILTLDGGAGGDTLRGLPNGGTTSMTGGPGTDVYEPGPGRINVIYEHLTTDETISINGLPDDPEEENVPAETYGIYGGSGDDELIGSDRSNLLIGGDGEDRLSARGGDDVLSGNADDDVLDGGPGTDTLGGDLGDDTQDGGPGDDLLYDGLGADTLRGGDGIDRATIGVADPTTSEARDASGSLNDVRDDGRAGERDDIRADVEDLSAIGGAGSGRATLTGDPDFNVLSGSAGADTITGGGGGDVLRGLNGDDTLDARDGADGRVECGLGTDSARVDAGDTVEDCETIDRAPPRTALPPGVDEDRPPSVSFVSPAAGAGLDGTSVVRVEASDDRGVGRVLLLRDGREVASDGAAPYEFRLGLTGADVGRSTLVAVAVDTADQTATAVRAVRVARFAPTLSAEMTRARDRRAPYRFTTRGRLRRPEGIDAAQGCRGVVVVRVKRGSLTVSTRRARVTRACAFSSTVTFRSRRRLGDGRLRFLTRFRGNAVLAPDAAPTMTGRAG